MQNTIKIGKLVPKRKFWRRLFKKWQKVLQLYINKVKDDLPYWHRERANTGFLSEACWRIGAVAVEEYWIQRKRKKGKKKVGSCDLFVRYKDFNFSVEAKQIWPAVMDKRNIDNIDYCLNQDAYGQLKDNIYGKKSKYLVAVCYVSPVIRKNKDFDTRSFVDPLYKHYNKHEIVAPFFLNPNSRRIYSEDNKYPGVVLIARIYKR